MLSVTVLLVTRILFVPAGILNRRSTNPSVPAFPPLNHPESLVRETTIQFSRSLDDSTMNKSSAMGSLWLIRLQATFISAGRAIPGDSVNSSLWFLPPTIRSSEGPFEWIASRLEVSSKSPIGVESNSMPSKFVLSGLNVKLAFGTDPGRALRWEAPSEYRTLESEQPGRARVAP